MKNNKVILLYGFSEKENSEISHIIQQHGLPGYKIIGNEMCNMKISDILEGFKFEILNQNLPKEKVVLFNNLNDNEIDIAIKSIKAAIPEVILAVITPTSIEWHFNELLDHLVEERNWFKKQQGK